jgi:hypothetical protein
MGLLMEQYFISKRGVKWVRILKFCIFENYIEFLFLIIATSPCSSKDAEENIFLFNKKKQKTRGSSVPGSLT